MLDPSQVASSRDFKRLSTRSKRSAFLAVFSTPIWTSLAKRSAIC